MKISKVVFERDYEFELPSSVEVPEGLVKVYDGKPDKLLLYVLFKLICNNPDEVVRSMEEVRDGNSGDL